MTEHKLLFALRERAEIHAGNSRHPRVIKSSKPHSQAVIELPSLYGPDPRSICYQVLQIVASPAYYSQLRSELSPHTLSHNARSVKAAVQNSINQIESGEMSRDIFAVAASRPPSMVHHGLGSDSIGSAQNGSPSNLIPEYPEVQRLMDAMDAEREIDRGRKEIEMDTPENRQKAAEAKIAERERKRINFHFGRAMSKHVREGWKQIVDDLEDEEIRVYSTDYKQRRFWGIKPAGIGMFDFWEQNDPEISRFDDNIAMTWANPLVPPPITASDEVVPIIWVGQGLNPDVTAPELPIAEVSLPTKAAARSRKRQKTPEVNPKHRVRKSATEPQKVNKNTRKSLAEKVGAGDARLQDQVGEVPLAAHTNGRPIRNKKAVIVSDVEQNPVTEHGGSAPTKRPRGRPATKTKSAANDSKRPRGRPPAKEKQAEKSPKQKKTPTVKGNARVTKSQKAKPRPSAPSTHKMRTRGEGPAELLRLP